jgi:hypothetical protein
MTSLFSTAYWPNISYFASILKAEQIEIEAYENYQKQSFRNRTQILSANGVLDLSIPVVKNAPKELMKDVRISYTENWQQKHWRAFTSAYRNSPYFDFFEDEIQSYYNQKFETLLVYNSSQLNTLCKLFRIKKEISQTREFVKEPQNTLDLRESFHPKKPSGVTVDTVTYYQTFHDKFPFEPNLSVLDLLFNEGPKGLTYLERLT